MKPMRMFGIAVVFGAACIAWMTLGGVTRQRTYTQDERLGPEVNDLWGQPHNQTAPKLSFGWTHPVETVRTEVQNGETREIRTVQDVAETRPVDPASTTIAAQLGLDQRLKGLIWYSLYRVEFDGTWTYLHRGPEAGKLQIAFTFPDRAGIYDGFRFEIDGVDRAQEHQPQEGVVTAEVEVKPGQTVTLGVKYRSRGKDSWRYVPTEGVASLEKFRLEIDTDFRDIDFPPGTISPVEKREVDGGWALIWAFDRVVTGQQIGIATPEVIQPGQLAAALSFSAPVSLLFFFLVIFVLATIRRIDIHPINYLFLAGAFFAFHLLFAYSVDHLAVIPAFAMCSVVSIALVVSYLRLVVSSRFAFVEAAAAQLVYLVGFSLAHFWEGFTGLTVTILSIVTLFLLMQLTGRIKWSEVMARPLAAPPPPYVDPVQAP